ncbi:type II secretion system protein [Dechloromonas sp. HYN0024]|uniref:type II secretion system protein n=1 Tax=Dechloromonas sp. HYN0024 TaxID=2231055 RepID=UPI000E43D7D0|nr:type II secretion system protein [Dechloromonas sp. HYN0024]AXS80139.1 type II secretion system protein [Dechloromonas sp. HYN0024]
MKKNGFTLIELMVVMAIIATLLAISSPKYFQHLHRAQESALHETLFVVRDAIDKFHSDQGRYPDSLDELVERRYLRSLPIDPVTDSTSTWEIVPPPSSKTKGSVYDLHSGAPGESRSGTPFAEW